MILWFTFVSSIDKYQAESSAAWTTKVCLIRIILTSSGFNVKKKKIMYVAT